jgi:hypothetical protein
MTFSIFVEARLGFWYDLLVIDEAHCCDIGSPYVISRRLYNDVGAQKVAMAEYLVQ